jgi:hypothetical protein
VVASDFFFYSSVSRVLAVCYVHTHGLVILRKSSDQDSKDQETGNGDRTCRFKNFADIKKLICLSQTFFYESKSNKQNLKNQQT